MPAGRNIDFNRGVTIRDEPASHAQVYMYKDEPGVYRNVYGLPVPEKLAEAAGFPVEELARERKFNADLAAAKETLRGAMDAGRTNRKVVKEGSEYNMVQVGKEAFVVETVDGKPMHPGQLSKQVADLLYNSLEPERPKAPKAGKGDTDMASKEQRKEFDEAQKEADKAAKHAAEAARKAAKQAAEDEKKAAERAEKEERNAAKEGR